MDRLRYAVRFLVCCFALPLGYFALFMAALILPFSYILIPALCWMWLMSKIHGDLEERAKQRSEYLDLRELFIGTLKAPTDWCRKFLKELPPPAAKAVKLIPESECFEHDYRYKATMLGFNSQNHKRFGAKDYTSIACDQDRSTTIYVCTKCAKRYERIW